MKIFKSFNASLILSACSLALLCPAVSLAAKAWIAPPGQADGPETQLSRTLAPLGALIATPDFTPPAGTVLYLDNGATECVTVSKSSADWIDIFGGDIQFTTGQATQVVEVNFNAQAAVGSGTVDNRLNFRCLISQDGVNWSKCGTQGTTNGVILARRVVNTGGTPPFTNQTNSGTYLGYSLVSPGTATQLRLQAKHYLADPSGSNSTVCYPTVVIRY